MIAVDSNVLVYAHRRAAPEHDAARAALGPLIEGRESWAIPWPCCYEFLSVMTNRRLWKEKATPPEVAWRHLVTVVDSTSSRLIGETPQFLEVLEDFVRRPRVRGALVHDARIAAICVAHGVDVLFTCDRDFSLFPELRTHNPLRR